MKRVPALLIIALCLLLTSCHTSKKSILWQDATPKSADATGSDTAKANKETNTYTVKIQPFDVLDIRIFPTDKGFQNWSELQRPSLGGPGDYFTGFFVDAEGYVSLPLIGRTKLTNLTIKEATEFVRQKLSQYLTDPYVEIKFLTFKVHVFGEVNRPGVITVPNEHATLIDAMGLAGDFTDFANVKEVKIIRGDPNNPQTIVIDLTSLQSTFTSEGFQLKPNDIIYVSPLKRKFFVANATIFLSMFTVLNTFILLFFRINNR